MRIIIFGGDSDIAKAISKKMATDVDLVTRKDIDITNFGNVSHYIKKAKPEVIINCAGVIYPATIKDGNVFDFNKEVNVNLIGLYFICKVAAENNVKKVINIASSSGLKGRAGWAGYCASKAGAISLIESLREEGIEAYSIILHRTATKMRKRLFPNEDQSKLLTPDKVADNIIDIMSYGDNKTNIEI